MDFEHLFVIGGLDTLIARNAVEPPAGSALWRLREKQDRRFFS